jgi:hypothetical protein
VLLLSNLLICHHHSADKLQNQVEHQRILDLRQVSNERRRKKEGEKPEGNSIAEKVFRGAAVQGEGRDGYGRTVQPPWKQPPDRAPEASAVPEIRIKAVLFIG